MHTFFPQGASTTASDCTTGSDLLSQTPAVKTWTSLITNYLGASFMRAQCWDSAEATSYWFNFVSTPNVSCFEFILFLSVYGATLLGLTLLNHSPSTLNAFELHNRVSMLSRSSQCKSCCRSYRPIRSAELVSSSKLRALATPTRPRTLPLPPLMLWLSSLVTGCMGCPSRAHQPAIEQRLLRERKRFVL